MARAIRIALAVVVLAAPVVVGPRSGAVGLPADEVVGEVIHVDRPERSTGLGQVVAYHFYDRNANGVEDEGEPPVEGWRIRLTGVDLAGRVVPAAIATTAGNGCVVFEGLVPGTYEVEELTAGAGGTGVTWVASTPTTVSLALAPPTSGCGPEGETRLVKFGAYLSGATARFDSRGYWHDDSGRAELTVTEERFRSVLAFLRGLAPYAEAEISGLLVDPVRDGGAREQLARQLLAFILNVFHRMDDPGVLLQVAEGEWKTGNDLIADAIYLWLSGTDSSRVALENVLDKLNHRDAVPFVPFYPCDVVYD